MQLLGEWLRDLENLVVAEAQTVHVLVWHLLNLNGMNGLRTSKHVKLPIFIFKFEIRNLKASKETVLPTPTLILIKIVYFDISTDK